MSKVDERARVKITKVDPEVLRSGGKGLDKAMKKAKSKEVQQEVFDRRAEKAREAERSGRTRRIKQSRAKANSK